MNIIHSTHYQKFMMSNLQIDSIDIEKLCEEQLILIQQWYDKKPFEVEKSFLSQAWQQHRYNYELWNQEDLARDTEASDTTIAQVKRKIDALNQQRNDQIEKLDTLLFELLMPVPENTPFHSETPGNMIDRLSINALKIYHMKQQTQRENATKQHRQKCLQKLQILQQQRQDLILCLKELIHDLWTGKKQLKVYYQMKMYNDPSLNPVLYQNQKS